MTWINDLDALASAGVIGFDAPAYITGRQPRYYGNPSLETIPDKLPQIKEQPQKDEFKFNNEVNNPWWKKVLFGTFFVTGLVFGASKLKSVKNLFKKINFSAIKALPKKALDGLKNVWNSVLTLFKSKKP